MSVADGTGPRVPLIAGNWKMYKTSGEGAAFVRELVKTLSQVDDREVVVAPPFTGLFEAVRAAEGSRIAVASQDVFWETEGPYTGEVAAAMLVDLGVRAAIIGHSERRQCFGETDDIVARKIRATLDEGLLAIVCVGESDSERAAGLTDQVLSTQVPSALAVVRPDEAHLVAIAYEPIWAIGTGKTATPEMAQEVAAFVRSQVRMTLGANAARAVRVLYGGSVKVSTIDQLMVEPDIDGVLVGGASLQADAFARIVRFERLGKD